MMHANVNTINPSNYNRPVVGQTIGTSYTNDTYQNVMNSIQKHYLVQNANGTFSIKQIAYQIYPKTIMDQITQGMDSMNTQILAGNIEFKVDANKNVNVEYVNQEAVNKAFFEQQYSGIGFNFMSSQFVHEYCYNFHYNWSGFYCAVSVEGCRVLRNELAVTINTAGGLMALTAVSGNVVISAGCGIDAVYAGVIQSNLIAGINSGMGATLSAWGSPMGKSVIYYASANN
ncbi:MAG: hypothetical protein ACRCWM_13320 [Sarcina sp.]